MVIARFVGQMLDSEGKMPLTDAQIRSLKAGGKRIRRSDGGGLFLDVMTSGSKYSGSLTDTVDRREP